MNRMNVMTAVALVVLASSSYVFFSERHLAMERSTEALRDVSIHESLPSTPIEGIEDGVTVEGSWERLFAAATAEDCETFRAFVNSKLGIGDNDCVLASNMLTEAVPDIDWGATIFEKNGTVAKLFLHNGSVLTTFLQEEDGIWRANTMFWRN